MKKSISLFLSIILLMGMVLCLPFSASAITIEEMDTDDTLSAFYDFESRNFMKVGPQSYGDDKAVWNNNPDKPLEYYYSAWGFGEINNNTVKEDTGVEGSIVNSSSKALVAKKTKIDNYPTSGGIVINKITDKGIEPLILENNTTYTVEFDYLVKSTHTAEDTTIANNREIILSFGYGYKLNPTEGAAPVDAPVKEVAKVVSYSNDNNDYGSYTSVYQNTDTLALTNVTEKVGSWYHKSFTFTTGTFGDVYSETNAPFLIFYAKKFTNTNMMVDNIRISKHITVNFQGMGGTLSYTTDSGKGGDDISFPTATRYGYEFDGWYTDSACTQKVENAVFTKSGAGATYFAGWTQGIHTFESYAPAGNYANFTTRFSVVSGQQAYSGTHYMQYTYSTSYTTYRTDDRNYFTIRPLSSNCKYKISFKYYISSGADITVYPVTAGTYYSSTTGRKTYTDAQLTLKAAGLGKWQTASLVFTTSDMTSGYNNLGLHVHANANNNTVVYFDDIKVTPLVMETADGTETIDSGTLTISSGNYESVAAGATSRTVALAVGDRIDSAFVYNGGYAVEGYYTDAGLTNKVPADVYSAALKGDTVYPKFSDRVDLTADGSATRTGGFVKANYEDALYYNYNGSSSKASLAQVTSGKKYMVEFLYKNNGSNDVTLAAENGSFIAKSGNNDKWYKGYIPVTATSTGVLELTATGNSSLEIKEVYIKDLTDRVYIIFDSTEYGGEMTAVYGTAGAEIRFPANPIVEGKKFDGWYDGQTMFSAEVFSDSSITLTAVMSDSDTVALGDCNGDGICNTADLAKMKLYLVKEDAQISAGADINNDGKINAIDLVLLKKELLK